MLLRNIPGRAEASARELLIRESAFALDVQLVGDFEAVQLTLERWLRLRLIRSPLLAGECTPEALAVFLWLVSPDWTRHAKARARFLRRCRCFQPPAPPRLHVWPLTWSYRKRLEAAEVCYRRHAAAALEYMSEAMLDAPDPDGKGAAVRYYGDAAYLCWALGSKWSQRETLRTPLKAIWQYMVLARRDAGERQPGVNKLTDKVTHEYLEAHGNHD